MCYSNSIIVIIYMCGLYYIIVINLEIRNKISGDLQSEASESHFHLQCPFILIYLPSIPI